MSALGVIICGISVGMFKHASLGVDPFQSFMSGLDAVIPIRFGTLYVIVNLLLLTFALYRRVLAGNMPFASSGDRHSGKICSSSVCHCHHVPCLGILFYGRPGGIHL